MWFGITTPPHYDPHFTPRQRDWDETCEKLFARRWSNLTVRANVPAGTATEASISRGARVNSVGNRGVGSIVQLCRPSLGGRSGRWSAAGQPVDERGPDLGAGCLDRGHDITEIGDERCRRSEQPDMMLRPPPVVQRTLKSCP